MSTSSIVVRTRYTHSIEMNKNISKWADYVSKKEKADATSLDDKNILNEYFALADKDSYLFEKCESFTWGSNGDANVKKDIKGTNIPYGYVWNLVISFPPDFAINNGLITKADYFDLTNNIMPSLITDMGLKLDNTNWYASLHRNTKHPHMHILIYENVKTASSGFIPKFAVKNIKSNIASYLIDNKKFYELRDKEFSKIIGNISEKELSKVKGQKLYSDKFRKELNTLLLDFYNILPKTGRLQYNSKNMILYKGDLNKIIEFVLMHDSVKYEYANYLKLLEQHQKELIELYGMTYDNKNRKYYNDQLNRLYSKIGNEILSNYKKYQSLSLMEIEKSFLKKHINELNFKSKKDYKKKETILAIGKDLYKICMMANLNDKETNKVFQRWIKNSNYDLDIDLLIASSITKDYEMSSTDYYNALKKLGYDYDRYSKFKSKYFYKELNYKKFVNQAFNHLMYELDREEKEIINQIKYELL